MTPERWHQVTEIFHRALERAVDDRADFVAARCADDLALRQDVEAMLAAHDSSGPLSDASFGLGGPRLAPGDRLGAYEIVALLGSGGMGEVFRARDTKLHRDVALKVLQALAASDPDRLSRFANEARVLAALNHPHIAQLYGIHDGVLMLAPGGRADRGGPNDDAAVGPSITALVMELIEGETLADLIDKARHRPASTRTSTKSPVDRDTESQRPSSNGLPLDDALALARQIAEALEAAHAQGIVHRDLKPANIKVRPDGTVKVLDFGLAKAIEQTRAASSDPSSSPTITFPARTEAGMILGTAAYMSPEQARGRPVDKRSDIWAFGCVFYEMLTGRRAFDGEDAAITLSNVIQSEPDWTALPSGLPEPVMAFLRQSLAKDPRKRVCDAGDMRLALDGAFDFSGPGPHSTGASPRAGLWQRPESFAAVVCGVAAAASLTTWVLSRPAPSPPATVVRNSIVLPPSQVRTNFGRRAIAISPSGSHLVYVASDQLYLRAFDELEARPMSGTEHASPLEPFFSPDGQWIGFFSLRDQALEKIALGGGAAVKLASAGATFGASWGDDHSIVYAQEGRGILRVAESGGEPTVLIPIELPARAQQPQILPGGQSILYTLCAAKGCSRPEEWDEAQVVVEDMRTRERTVVVNGGADARYIPTGHVIYTLGNRLLGVPFDVSSHRATSGPVVLVEGISRASTTGVANADVSRTGTLAYMTGDVETARTLVWVDRTGREEIVQVPARPYYGPRLSPDGTSVLVYANDAERDLWMWDFSRKSLTRLTVAPATEMFGLWTPDGRRLVFSSDRSALLAQSADGTGTVERLKEGSESLWPTSISPDGARLVYMRGSYEKADLEVMTLDAEHRTESLIASKFGESNAEISPDGRWLAYQSNASGEDEVYVQPFPEVARGRWKISTAGGTEPLWSPEGRELFYRDRSNFMRATIETTDGFKAGPPDLLFSGDYLGDAGRSYDISHDGKRFLTIKQQAKPGDPLAVLTQIVVVQHWFQELTARVSGASAQPR